MIRFYAVRAVQRVRAAYLGHDAIVKDAEEEKYPTPCLRHQFSIFIPLPRQFELAKMAAPMYD